MTSDKTGRVVWHDYFTDDPKVAMDFYRDLAGWSYTTEHSEEFAWGGGAQDYVLAELDGEAGAGFARIPEGRDGGWVAYVEVGDVDNAAARAAAMGGTILRPPFEVPGVGRNALVADPRGAVIGLALSRHDFPIPTRQFGPELYLSEEPDFPETFYLGLFGWHLSGATVTLDTGDPVAVRQSAATADTPARWVPQIWVPQSYPASRTPPGTDTDPTGALFHRLTR